MADIELTVHFSTTSGHRVLHSCRRRWTSCAFTDPFTSSKLRSRFERTLLLVYCSVMSHRHEPPNSTVLVVTDADSGNHSAPHCRQSTFDSAALLIREISHSGGLWMAVLASSHRTSIRGSHQTCRSPKEVSGAAYAISLHHGFPRLQLTSLLLQKQEPKRSHPQPGWLASFLTYTRCIEPFCVLCLDGRFMSLLRVLLRCKL